MTTYREAGVDLDGAERAVSLIRAVTAGATREEVLEGVGGFAALYRIPGGTLLAAATDGVGTKIEVARWAGRVDTVGIDLVAMCADDVVCTGAAPAFFLDYLAVGRLVPEEVAAIVEGVAEGSRRAGCALIGGETAEHPGVLEAGRFDLAGFCVGLLDEGSLLGPARVREGDVLIGLASSGLHSNGYSLVRRVLVDPGGHAPGDVVPELGRPLGEELLEPTRIYAPLVVALAGESLLSAAAHVTGGGIPENVPRAVPEDLGVEVDPGSWPVPPVFDLVERASGASREEMFRTFNMGIGMVLVVPPSAEEAVSQRAERSGVPAYRIGRVVAGGGFHMPLDGL
jgi:phosphoribosylformylglycinamidine cyclo-ligase